MKVPSARLNREYVAKTQSDRNLDGPQNFDALLGSLFSEKFYQVLGSQCSHAGKNHGFSWKMSEVRTGLVRLYKVACDPCTVAYRILSNRYHGYVSLLMPIEGGVTLTLAERDTFPLSPGQCIIFNPNHTASLAVKPGTEFFLVLLSSNYFNACTTHYTTVFENLVVSSQTQEGDFFISLLQSLSRITDGINIKLIPLYCEAVCVALKPLMTVMFLHAEDRFKTRQDFIRACSVEAMFKHIEDADASSETIAKEVGVSPRYLSQLFQEVGTTVRERFMAIRLERASTQLRQSMYEHLSVLEIAKQNGFVNLSHFCRVFKQRYNKTPLQWRRDV